MVTTEGSYWKSIGANPGMIAAADQVDKQADDYLNEVIERFIELEQSTDDLPLTAAALGFYHSWEASTKLGLYFAAHVMALAVKRLAEQKEQHDG